MKIIVGLGNPGNEYINTRHNVGFLAIDSIVNKYGIKCDKTKFNALYTSTIIENKKVLFIKPQKYINLSGEVIKKFLDYFDIPIENLLIIHDDLDLEIGKFKLKQSGGSGGHNGLKNIELNILTDEYKRLKIGISNDKNCDTKNYVLGKFNVEEQEKIEQIIKEVPNIVNDFINLDFIDLMNKYNRK